MGPKPVTASRSSSGKSKKGPVRPTQQQPTKPGTTTDVPAAASSTTASAPPAPAVKIKLPPADEKPADVEPAAADAAPPAADVLVAVAPGPTAAAEGPATPSAASSVKQLLGEAQEPPQPEQQDSQATIRQVAQVQESLVPPVHQQEPPGDASSPTSLPAADRALWGSVNASPEQGPAAAGAVPAAAAASPDSYDLAAGSAQAPERPAMPDAAAAPPPPPEALAGSSEGPQAVAADDSTAAAAAAGVDEGQPPWAEAAAAPEAVEAPPEPCTPAAAPVPGTEQEQQPARPATNAPQTETGTETPAAEAPAETEAAPTAMQSAQPPPPAPAPTLPPAAAAVAAPRPSEVRQHVPPLSEGMLPAVGVCELTEQQLGVLGAWQQLYCAEAEAGQGAALAQAYDPAAMFEDNFVQVCGHEQIAAQFYALRRLTAGIDLALEKVELLDGPSPDAAASGGLLQRVAAAAAGGAGHNGDTYQLRVISRIYFHLPAIIRGPMTSLLLPKALEAWATDTLTVRRASDGRDRVVHHRQQVHNLPTLPWLVRAPAGRLSSWGMMYLLGW